MVNLMYLQMPRQTKYQVHLAVFESHRNCFKRQEYYLGTIYLFLQKSA